MNIYFNSDNTCNVTIINIDGDEKVYNNIPYKINLNQKNLLF